MPTTTTRTSTPSSSAPGSVARPRQRRSAQLFADTLVPRFAAAYARAHPNDAPLGTNDDGRSTRASRPRRGRGARRARAVRILRIPHRHGRDGRARQCRSSHRAPRCARPPHWAGGNGRVALWTRSRRACAGRREHRMETRARLASLALRDRRSRRAQRAVSAFDFDANSFTIESREGKPRVVYAVPGEASRGSLSALALAPREVPAMAWWHALRDELPAGPDRCSAGSTPASSCARALADDGDVAHLDSATANHREWRVGTVGAPLWRVTGSTVREARRSQSAQARLQRRVDVLGRFAHRDVAAAFKGATCFSPQRSAAAEPAPAARPSRKVSESAHETSVLMMPRTKTRAAMCSAASCSR